MCPLHSRPGWVPNNPCFGTGELLSLGTSEAQNWLDTSICRHFYFTLLDFFGPLEKCLVTYLLREQHLCLTGQHYCHVDSPCSWRGAGPAQRTEAPRH